MIIPDLNVLVHASNRQSDFHEPAREWWFSALNGIEPVGLASVVTTGFVRLTTSTSALSSVTVETALKAVDAWFSSPVVRWIAPTEHHVHVMRSLLVPLRRGGRLVNDAHLAALAIEHGGTVYSQDTDFAAFPSVRWVNPLA